MKGERKQTPTDRIRSLWNNGRKPTKDEVAAAILGEMFGILQNRAELDPTFSEDKRKRGKR